MIDFVLEDFLKKKESQFKTETFIRGRNLYTEILRDLEELYITKHILRCKTIDQALEVLKNRQYLIIDGQYVPSKEIAQSMKARLNISQYPIEYGIRAFMATQLLKIIIE
jgi:hypothetical protein